MTNKWRAQKHHVIKSRSSKAVGELGYAVDLNFNSPVYRALPSTDIRKHDFMQGIINRFVHCPRCSKQVELMESPNPKLGNNNNSKLISISIAKKEFLRNVTYGINRDIGLILKKERKLESNSENR